MIIENQSVIQKINNDEAVLNKINSESATIEHLVALIVSSNSIVNDRSFLFSFFLSSRVFISTNDLLFLLFEKSIHFLSNHKVVTNKIISENLTRLVIALGEWAKYFPHDFRINSMNKSLNKIKNKCALLDESFTDDFNRIISYIDKKNQDLSDYEFYLKKLHLEMNTKENRKINNDLMEICDLDPKLFAIQLTHIEYDRLSHIGAEEFIHYFLSIGKFNIQTQSTDDFKHAKKYTSSTFKKYLNELKHTAEKTETDSLYMDKEEGKKFYIKSSANLEAYILWFNRLSNSIAFEIVKCTKISHRAILIEFFIDAAYSCFELGNFNSTMAIIAALNFTHISRLKKTWQKVDTKKLEILSESTDSSNNYFLYRNILEEKFKESKKKDTKIMIIPIFTIVMRDLNHLFYTLASQNLKGYLNIERFWEMAKYISKHIMIRNQNFEFIESNNIINYILTEPILTVEACAYVSFRLEEPDSPNEIKYYNELKNIPSNNRMKM